MGSVTVICAIALVLVTAFLVARLLCKKRWQSGDSGKMNVNNLQQQIDGSLNASSSSSSSESVTGHEFEVFLSFRGSDIRKNFADHLYQRLIDAGVRAFRDNEELRVGEEIGLKIMKSIQQSKIGIPIFSADYASSRWCLMEAAEMVKSMKQGKQLIMPIFYNVTPDEVQHQTGNYAGSFSQHEKRFGREKVQGWRDALKEVVKLKGLELAKVANGREGAFTKLVVTMVIKELKKSSLEVGDILIGIEDRAEELVKKLEIGTDEVRFVGIWGMGGIGKTTLAKFVYNQVVSKFESSSFFENIRETSRHPRGLQSLQSKLVSDILKQERVDYLNIDDGISVLKERLRGKNALILLDDVGHMDQIKALAADVGWFGKGSRIIITTRKKKLLDQVHVKDIYEVTLLDEHQALELFCRHAFGDKLPRPDLAEHARKIVNITGNLPLALVVIGSSLSVYTGKKDLWDDTIKKLMRKPDMKVQDTLRISYESLEREEQEIFLDIACFFIGVDVRLVIPMWDDSGFYPKIGIETLQQNSLIKIREDNAIWMHDQLRDLGRSIVNDMDKEPGHRSRLWNSKDAFKVLVRQQGTNKVEGICLEGHCFTEEDDCLTDQMFSKLPNLRILELASARLDGNFHLLLSELRWLSWHIRNMSPPENLFLNDLIVLDLSQSIIDEKWKGWSSIKIGLNLKVLKLSNCQIREMRNFSRFPSLESLILESCELLEWVDPSIGLLKNLILLNLKNCGGLEHLPHQLGSLESLVELLIDGTGVRQVPLSSNMRKLEVLSANHCRNLSDLPASIGSLKNLKRLSLSFCSKLRELPDSTGQLTSLVELTLSNSSIRKLPDFHGDLHNLEYLRIEYTSITHLPSNLGSLRKLKMLNASRLKVTAITPSQSIVLKVGWIESLPESMNNLSCLQTLNISCSDELHALPELPSSLIKLRVVASSKLISFNLANLVNLKELILHGDFEVKAECLSSMRKLEELELFSVRICALPKEISLFSRLKRILINYCDELKYVPTLPSSLSTLRINFCCSLETMPDLSNLKQLLTLSLLGCERIRNIDSVSEAESLVELDLKGCISLTKLPNQSKLQRLKRIDMRRCENIRDLPRREGETMVLYLPEILETE